MALDPTIPLGVKPIDFLGSAGNLLNLARGAQALEQEQTLNPIQAEKARIELGIARDTQQAEIARQKALSTQAQTGAERGQFELGTSYEERMRRVLAGLPQTRSFQNLLQDPSAALMDVRDAEERLIASGVPKKTAVLMTSSLTSQIADARRAGDMTPVNNWFYNNIIGSQTPSAQQQLLAPAGTPQVTFGGVPGSVVSTPRGAEFRPMIIEQSQPMPAQQMPQQGVQTGGVSLSTGIQERPVDLSLSETGPAAKQGAGVPLMQSPAQAQPRGVTAEAMSMPGLRYPVRTGGPFAPLQGEEADRETGLKYVNGLVSLQPQMQTTRRNIQEVVSKASEIEKNAYRSTGVLGAAERKIRELVGDSNYQQLSKDLANLQISLIQSKGGSLDTVAGQGLAAHANGDKTYAPDVLKSIARRTYGDVLATEAEGAAADLFRQRYGDANHAAFKQLWSKNSDSRVFELMGLEDLVQDPKEQEKVAREVILKGLSAKQIDELTKKYKNIKRLRETGSL
jgi:hypothetical protein